MSEDKHTNTETLARERAWLLNEKYGGVETPAFFSDLKRYAAGVPLAYLIGHIPFLDTTIFLDSKPLIPRPETEYWVEQAIEEIGERALEKGKGVLSMLDLCAGSGCIGIAVLKAIEKQMPNARVDFSEIDTGHHETIRKNLKENNIEPARAQVFGGDLFTKVPKTNRYDFILTNPPYIDPNQSDRVAKNVKEYEPAKALFGGKDGMEYITKIIQEALHYLANSGILYIEHEPEQTSAIHALAQSLGYASCETHKDQFRIDRYTRLMRAK